MKARSLASVLAVLIIAALVAGGCASKSTTGDQKAAATAKQADAIKWKVQGFTPAGTLFYDWGKNFCDTVNKLSGGRMVLEYYPPGAIVPPMEALNAVRDGILDVNYGYSGMWIGQFLAAPLFCSTPGGFGPQDFLMWMEYGGGKELHREMYTNYNVEPIIAGAIGMEIFMWSNKPFKTVEDMKGAKLRMMPLMGEVLKDKGLSIAFLPAGEILPSLDRKVLDAAEYSIPAFDKTLGFQDVCKYYHYPGIHQPTGATELLINKKKWDQLPDDLKDVVRYAAKIGIIDTWLQGEYLNIKALEEFEKKGAQRVVMDSASVDQMIQWADEWMDRKSKENAFLGKVRASQKEFSKKWYPYKRDTTLPPPKWAMQN